MRYLLDTHVWIWMGLEPERLGEHTRVALADQRNVLYLSIVSVWEMVIKIGRGKLKLPLDVQTFVRRFLPVSRTTLLQLSLDHIFAVANLPDRHRDPFDRIIVAQALVEGVGLMTADPGLFSYPVSTLDARQ